MKISEPEQLRCWQAAHAFKLEVYRLVESSPGASRDFRYRDQLRESARAPESDIAEGFRRRCPALGYFSAAASAHALSLGDDCDRHTLNFHDSQQRLIKRGFRVLNFKDSRDSSVPKRAKPPLDSSDSSDS